MVQGRAPMEEVWLWTRPWYLHASCQWANLLINSFRNKHRYQCITSAVIVVVCGAKSRTDHQDATTLVDIYSSVCCWLSSSCIKSDTSSLECNRLDAVSSTVRPLESDRSVTRWCPSSNNQVEKLIRLMTSKSSPLDPFATLLIKQFSNSFAPVISRLANLSFEHATFPANFFPLL